MDVTAWISFIKQVGFNGALVVFLLWASNRFLDRLLNHISHIQLEMEKHTVLLNTLVSHSHSRSRRKKSRG